MNTHVIEKVLDITYVENRGGAFGVGQNSTISFIIINAIILGVIIRFMIIQKEMMERKTEIALAIIVGGGVSNLIDRMFRGFVLDFIDFSPLVKFPVFNIADMLIIVGWLLLVIFTTSYYLKNRKGGKVFEKSDNNFGSSD